jgi:hypothetical protein
VVQAGSRTAAGIKASLAERNDMAAWSDAETLLFAVRPGVSRFGTHRSIGLTQALETVRRCHGLLAIRSGTARGSLFPGTPDCPRTAER